MFCVQYQETRKCSNTEKSVEKQGGSRVFLIKFWCVLRPESVYIYTVGFETNQYLKEKIEMKIYGLINVDTDLTFLCKI